MKFTLTDYQEEVTEEALAEILDAVSKYRQRRRLTAVGISAPTGAGKTVIAASLLERLYYGDAEQDPNRNLTILWVTDDGDLNEQSKEKIETASDLITNQMMETVDAQFDQRILDPGKIYFLNVQKLGSGATRHIKVGDTRRYSLWETIGATAAERGSDFLVLIDEAHRGSGDTKKPTILRQIIDGGKIDVKDENGVLRTIFNLPAPVIVGISATPKKFEDAMKTNTVTRTVTPVVADVSKVRESGLIKDKIDVYYSTDDHPTDDTLVRQAVKDLIAYDAQWESKRIESKGRDEVKPLLVVQVPDLYDSKVGKIVEALTDSWSGFDHPDSIAHAFGNPTGIEVTTRKGGLDFTRTIKYMAPQDITKDNRVRAVIFKTALTTGWDCPRAEVMVSLRTANEYTLIAQLIGRMVRTPLARRIEEPGFEALNSVALYLPKYNEKEVATVVKSFLDDENIESSVTINPVTLRRNPAVPNEVWNLANTLPKELKPSRTYKSSVSRLVALAIKLDNYHVVSPSGEDFSDEAEELLVRVMDSEYQRLKSTIDPAAASLLTASFATKGYETLSGVSTESTALAVATSVNNLAELQRESVRKLPSAVASWTESHLIGQGMDEREVTVRVAAMSRMEDIHHALERESERLIAAWQTQVGAAVSLLDAKKQRDLNAVWHPAGKPKSDVLELPQDIKAKTQVLSPDGKTVIDLPRYSKHLYVDEEGLFPEKFTTWEEQVLKTELSRDSLVAWYRNPSSASNGLSVSYSQQDVDKSLFPDLIFFHRSDDGLAVDIVDPHNHSLADTSAKWAALARFTSEHEGTFRRVSIVIRNKVGILKAINLAGQATDKLHEGLLNASNKEDFEKIFENHGSNY